MANLNQYEVCDRILEYIVSKPEEWHCPLKIQSIILKSVSIEKIKYLFDYMAMTQQPEPTSFQRNLENNWWVIKMNGYTNEFLMEGGFSSRYQAMLEESQTEEERNALEREKLLLETENLKYRQTIRDQDQRIRNLTEQNSSFQLIKNYWWLILLSISIGVFLGKTLW